MEPAPWELEGTQSWLKHLVATKAVICGNLAVTKRGTVARGAGGDTLCTLDFVTHPVHVDQVPLCSQWAQGFFVSMLSVTHVGCPAPQPGCCYDTWCVWKCSLNIWADVFPLVSSRVSVTPSVRGQLCLLTSSSFCLLYYFVKPIGNFIFLHIPGYLFRIIES